MGAFFGVPIVDNPGHLSAGIFPMIPSEVLSRIMKIFLWGQETEFFDGNMINIDGSASMPD
jgi:hypothetical protein